MKKLFLLILLFVSFSASAQRFPSVDSLKNYILRYVKNSATESFTNLRMQNVVYGLTEFFQTNGIDTIWKAGDTLKYRKNGVNRTVGLFSGGGGGSTDTTSLSNRINLKLTITDTSAMLANYIRRQELRDTASALRTDLNGKQGALTLTTTGTSGASTLTGNTLNIPQYSGGGGGSTTVNDSLFYGIKYADSSVTGQTKNPSQLTWSLVSKQRVFELIDKNHIHYVSQFESGSMSDLITTTGTAPSLTTNGKLSVTGNTLIRTNNSPKAPFFTIELEVDNMGTVSTFDTQTAFGPALIKDASNYISGIYDVNKHRSDILVNGTSIVNKQNLYLNVKGLVLYLIANADGLQLWAKSDGVTSLLCTITSTYDLSVSGNLTGYYYGMQSKQAATVTTEISMLRAGASGGTGIINPKFVNNSDGSPYMMGNDYVITADWVPYGSKGGTNYLQGNAIVATLNSVTYEVNIIGRLYFKRSNFANDAVERIVGGAATKLRWFPDRKKWLLSYTFADDPTAIIVDWGDDQFIWLDPFEPFNETIISQHRYETFGFDKTTSPNVIYDVNTRYDKYTGTYYTLGDYSRIGIVNARLYYGNAINNHNQTITKDTATFYEGATWARLGATWYSIYWSYGDGIGIVYDMNMNTKGYINLGVAGGSRIGTYDYATHQKNGKTEYLLIGFDTVNATLNGVNYDWTRGNLNIYKSVDTSIGYEFKDIRYASIVKANIERKQYKYNGFNSLEFGSAELNNAFLAENAYYNPGTSTFKHRATGAAGLAYFASPEFQIRMKTTQSAAANFADNNSQFKVHADGTVSIGGAISATPGSTTGAIAVVNSNGLTVTRGTAGTMAKTLYEVSSFERNADVKFGIYTSSASSADAASITFGQTNLQASSTYPGFEFGYVYSATLASNRIRFNSLQRNSTGAVTGFVADMFSLYQNGNLNAKYKLYIGHESTTPTSLLHLSAGTASENTAPLKFTSGTNLTTPENGTVEFNGTDYFVTSGGVRYTLQRVTTVPASATATGVTGSIAYDSGFIYICVATNTWVRAALTTW